MIPLGHGDRSAAKKCGREYLDAKTTEVKLRVYMKIKKCCTVKQNAYE